MKHVAWMVAGAVVGIGQVAMAADESPEAKVLKTLHEVNRIEIQAAELAQEKAQSPDVRTAARQIAMDHRQSNEQVEQLAQSQGLQLAAAGDPDEAKKRQDKQDKALEKLQSAQGAEFDKEFTKLMAEQHDEAIKALSKARDDVQNPEVRKLLDTTLPLLEQHKEHAHQLKETVG